MCGCAQSCLPSFYLLEASSAPPAVQIHKRHPSAGVRCIEIAIEALAFNVSSHLAFFHRRLKFSTEAAVRISKLRIDSLNFMGLVLGKISVETPKYTVTASGEDYEIREYGASIVAEVSYDPAESKGSGFMILADYIGAIGKPQNVKGEDKGEKIAMTAPVLSSEAGKDQSEKIAMTAPVLTEERPAEVGGEGKKGPMVMQFVLPSKYTRLSDVPRPIDPRVRVKEVDARKYGVIKFSGIADDKLVEKKLERLKHVLQEAGYKVIGQHTLAQYNPPWTIPFLRTNEVLLPVE